MSAIENLTKIFLDMKTGAGVVVGTLGTSLAKRMEWLPDNWLTQTATVIGILLSLVLIYTHIKRHIREEKQSEIDLKLKKKQLKAPH